MSYDLSTLTSYANNYQFLKSELPIAFTNEPYTRLPIYKNSEIEIVLICFKNRQKSTIHHHQGSNCVIRVIDGELQETLFKEENDKFVAYSRYYLQKGDISGLDGTTIHQLKNIDENGTVLLNFYSPPFDINTQT